MRASQWLREVVYDNPIIFCTQRDNISETATLIDSGASDHCFTERLLFTLYNTLNNPLIRLSAGKESTFEITGKGRVEFLTDVDDAQRKIILDNALHTPRLRSNLILVLALDSKELYVTFGGGKAYVKTSQGKTIFSVTQFGQLYTIDISKPTTSTFIN